jgi:hypothetical protein
MRLILLILAFTPKEDFMSRSIFRLFLIITMLLSGTPTPPAAAQAEAPELVTFNALSLAGFDGYARVSHSSELNNLSAMTIEAWVWRNETLRGETIVGNGWTESYWLGFAPEGKLRFITHGGGDLVDSNVTVYAGEWTHVAVTYNGLTRNFYINGALDKTTNESPGAIAPNPSDPLGIGYDADPFTGNYFDGVLDEVRIWKTVRSQAEIQAGMFQAFSAPLPANLIGYWRLNGDASDETGDHDGIMQGGLGAYSWINGGALPHDIRIPQTSAAHTLNGRCDPSEYTSATVVSVEGAEIYLDHTATDLWVCYHFYTDSSYTRASVLLDLNHGRLDPAQPDDLRLDVHDDDTLGTYVGDDAGHWVITDTYDTLWDGEYTQYGPPEFPYYNIEFRLDQSLVGGWSHVIGLALDPYIPGLYGFDMAGIWPALAANTLPSTWSSATLGGISPPRTFSGKVEYQPKNLGYDPTSVAGAHIELIGYDVGGSEALVATDTTGPSGSFSLTTDDDYTQHRLEILGIPQGYNYTEADAPSPGTVLDERTIDYGEAGPGTYPDNTFTLGDVIPSNSSAPYGPVFLIIAPDEVIDSGALDEFRTFKIQQGYAVSIRSVEETNSYPGPTRLERIRALEQEYLQTYGARFQFLMLIGTHEVIPFAKITPYATGEGAVCPTEEPKNYKFSDWLYVDLTSNFDGNGNGCYADGALTNPDKLVSGYTPDSGIAFDPTVALGRLPFTDPNTIRNVLRNSVGFEKQSESYKLDALNGMSLVALKGYFDGEICSDNWGDHCVPPSSNSQYSYDTAVLSEEMKNDFLNVNGFDTTELYENEAAIAGGIGVSSPDLTLANVRQALDDGRFGLAVMSGHGNSTGVYRNFWASDKNGNGVVDVSDSSSSNELSETQFFDINGVLNQVGAEGSRGSVFVLLACSNASPTNSSNLAATILADGHGPASVAALSVVTVGSWLNENHGNVESIGYYVNKRLVSNSYRLGEAVWWTMADLVHKKISGSGGVAYDLYGDPTLSFYGNPGGQTTLAAWPMSRRDPAGASYLSLPGPTVPKKLWDYTTGPHGSDLPGQTPLVSANGEVIVAGGSYVDVLRQGVLHQRLSLDASIFGNPALSADGTIYAMDLDGNLYAFPYKRLTLNGHTIITSERYRRWTVDLGEYPQTAITIGSDGYILAGMGGSDPVLWMVRPDGVKFSSWALDHSPASYITTDASRAVYVATDVVPEGHLYRFNLFCDTFVYPDVCPHNSWVETTIPYAFNTPPILLYGSLYIGDVNNTLYKFNKDTLATEATFTADSAIMHGPMATPSGDVLIISSQGVMYSLTKNLATVRWQKNLGHTATFGIPAASSNAIYLAFDGYLRAYSPSGGGQLWKRSLGSEFAYAGVSVGYGREVYVQGVLGQVQAFGEGWALSLAKIVAIPGINLTRPYFRVEMLQNLPPISGTLQTTPLNPPILAPSEDAPAEGEAGREWGDEKGATADIVGILLQRSADGGPWEDLTILPPGAEVFTDTNIDANTRYAYRAQNLMSDGQNSDFATIPEIVQSYPNLPGAPTLEPVQPESADALQLTWASNPGDVVSAFRLERAENAGGPFTTVITLTSETTAFVDSGLAPATTYYYRVIALNDTGSSAPSNVEGGATRSQSLDSPQNFQAALANPGQISLTWDAGPTGATAVIEIEAFGMSSYEFLATAPADGSFTYHTGEPNAYDFRIKFVQGDDESTYAYSESVVIADPQVVYLPIVRK